MKPLAVISVLLFVGWQVDARAVVVQSSEDSKELDADDEACIAELHLDRNKIIAVDMGKILPEDDNFSQFMGCTSKKMGLLKPNGEIDFDKIAEELLEVARKDPDFAPPMFRIYKGIVTTSVESCRSSAPTGTTEGLTVIKTLNCVTKAMTEIMED